MGATQLEYRQRISFLLLPPTAHAPTAPIFRRKKIGEIRSPHTHTHIYISISPRRLLISRVITLLWPRRLLLLPFTLPAWGAASSVAAGAAVPVCLCLALVLFLCACCCAHACTCGACGVCVAMARAVRVRVRACGCGRVCVLVVALRPAGRRIAAAIYA
jgi:hypothetical protein